MRTEIQRQAVNFFIYVILQLPVLYRLVLFDKAFAFFYVAYLLLLPHKMSPTRTMTIGFVVGLLIDSFSNTPGIHAMACVILSFARTPWLAIVKGKQDEVFSLNVYTLGFRGFLVFCLPLILLHHFLIFFLENGGFNPFGLIFIRVIYSTVFSFSLIWLSNYLITSKK